MKKFLPILFLLWAVNVQAAVTVLYPTGDTALNPDAATTNYDTTASYEGDGHDHALIFKFDLSGIASEDVLNADFKVWGGSRGYQHNMVLSRLLRNFTSNQATWNIYSTGNSWGTVGAKNSTTDFVTTHQQTEAVPDTNWIVFDATDLVKDMIDNSTPNLLMRGDGDGMYQTWQMSEATGTTYDPRLVIRTGAAGVPTTWYVRPGGSTCGLDLNCTGTTNEDYVSGINQACACGSPGYLGSVMVGEDTAIIGAGSYETTAVVPPSGTSSSQMTKIYGEGWDTGCANAPELWRSTGGSGITLTGTSYVDIRCLEITDHSDSAVLTNGIYAEDSTGVNLKDLDIHGGDRGIMAGRLTDWDLTNVKLRMNVSAGWDGDISGTDSNSGTMNFTNVEISDSGCYEDYSTGEKLIGGCFSQDQGGYGDGLGTGGTGGTWNFIGCKFLHNVSDGLDLLYTNASTVVRVSRCLFEGNAGNNFKGPNDVIMENSINIGNCGYHYHQPFTQTPDQNDPRAGIYYNPGYATLTGTGISITNEAIATGDGGTLVFTGTTTKFPIKNSTPVISYTIGGTGRTATVGSYSTAVSLKGNISGVSIDNDGSDSGSPDYNTSYINYRTGDYKITFTTAPDNSTAIKFNSYTYDDAVPSGTYTGDLTVFSATTWDAEVTATGTPDVFKWRKDSGSYTANVEMTGSAQLLGEGVSIQFKETTGHTVGDVYHFSTCGASFNTCRANGNGVAINFFDDTSPVFINNTMLSNADVLFEYGGTCTTGTDLLVKNNILRGGIEFNYEINGSGSDESTSIQYQDEENCDADFVESYNICYGFKEGSSSCNGTGSTDTVDPLFAGTILQGPAGSYYTGNDYVDQVGIAALSPARDAGYGSVTFWNGSNDYNNYPQTNPVTIGALEYMSIPSAETNIYRGTWYLQ